MKPRDRCRRCVEVAWRPCGGRADRTGVGEAGEKLQTQDLRIADPPDDLRTCVRRRVERAFLRAILLASAVRRARRVGPRGFVWCLALCQRRLRRYVQLLCVSVTAGRAPSSGSCRLAFRPWRARLLYIHVFRAHTHTHTALSIENLPRPRRPPYSRACEMPSLPVDLMRENLIYVAGGVIII